MSIGAEDDKHAELWSDDFERVKSLVENLRTAEKN